MTTHVKQPKERYLVSYDLPSEVSKSTFHRRLNEIIDEFGGRANCKANGSVYIFSGEQACAAAYAVAVLAEEHGAPGFDEPNGIYVAQIVDVEPKAHFDELKRARQIVSTLSVNRRTKSGKLAPRSISAMVGAGETAKHSDKVIDMQDYLSQFDGDKRLKAEAKK